MAKPDVRVLVNGPLIAGRSNELTIEVTAHAATAVESIDVHLEGQQGWTLGHGKSRVSADAVLPDVRARLMGAGELPARSTTPFDLRFSLPRGTAPTHEVSPAHAGLRVRVHVSLPWRIDVRASFELPVRLPPPDEVERTPVVVSSARGRGGADQPRLDVSLASSQLVAGEVLVGSAALFNLDDRRRLDVELVPLLRLYGRGRPRERRGMPLRSRVELPADHGGRSIPLRVALPADLTPGFETVTHALRWQLEISSDTLLGRELAVRMPIQVHDATARARTERLTVAPRLADERVAALFTALAARPGWRVDPRMPDDDDPPTISRELDDGTEVRLAYAYRSDRGTMIRARVEHPSLGLGLTAVPGSLWRHLFWSDLEAGVPAWDRAHVVAARSGTQTRPFLAAAVPAIAGATVLGALVRWDDHALVFERAMPSIDEAAVAPMQAALEEIATVITAARALVAPPAGVTTDVFAWRELARWLDGDVAIGDLTLTGTLDGLPVSASLEWEGTRPVRVRGSAGEATMASDDVRSVTLRLEHPLADVLAAATPEAIVECVATWPTYITDVEVADGVASGAIALPGSVEGAVAAAPSLDASRVRALLVALRSLLEAVAPAAGKRP